MKIYLLVGCPGSGKSWVANNLKAVMDHLPHDNYIGKNYVSHITNHLKNKTSKSPVLLETPFSISQIKEPLEQQGINVECVYIQEPSGVIEDRYRQRDGKDIPKGHLTRQETYKQRAESGGSFFGTSQQVLDYLTTESSKGAAEGES